jgi:hypothetical protein
VAPELRWKDEGGVHKSQSRPRPSPREQLGRERFAGLVGPGGTGWRQEPGWRGSGDYRTAPWDPAGGGGARPGFRPGGSGGWREPRGRSGDGAGGTRTMPGERIARLGDRGGPGGGTPGSRAAGAEAPFVAGEIADRGPVERGAAPATPEPPTREVRELERQAQWREQATRALEAFRAEEGTGPANATDLVADDEALADRALAAALDEDGPALRVESGILPTLRVFPHGISRKRLEQAVKELQLPVIVARQVDEADVVMTLRSEYRQKGPTIRDAEQRALPVYVLKANTIVQMQASLTSIFSLEVDPREAALRETEEAIGLVVSEAQPVELAPQNAYIRRLQHQMAERANVVSRSRGREPYRRVRLYPDEARAWR